MGRRWPRAWCKLQEAGCLSTFRSWGARPRPPAWRPLASAHRDALNVYRQSGSLDWTCFSPAALIAPGTRTGQYRTGGDQLLTDFEGQSTISNEDFAVAMLDELEQPHFKRQRITVAY